MKLAACLSAAITLLHVRAVSAGCERDDDCKRGRVCEARVCVAPPPAAATCRVDRECPGDQICERERCIDASAEAAGTTRAAVPPAPAVPALGDAFAAEAVLELSPSVPTARLAIEVDTPGGPRRCVAPCQLSLAPGNHVARVSGDATFEQNIVVPEQGAHLVVDYKRTANKQRIIGGGMLGGGALFLGLGLVGLSEGSPIIAGVCMPLGGIGLLTGVMLMIIPAHRGANSMTAKPAPATASRGSAPVLWSVTPTEGGAMGGATWTF